MRYSVVMTNGNHVDVDEASFNALAASGADKRFVQIKHLLSSQVEYVNVDHVVRIEQHHN